MGILGEVHRRRHPEEILQLLHRRVQAGAAIILIKIKSHRGEPMNEYADEAATEGRQAHDDRVQWNKDSGCIIF